jgi:DNA-binding transcriptional LysR family regulator
VRLPRGQVLTRSQPSVTRQVQDLERLLGVALFDRTGRSLRVTDAGRVLLEDARRTMAAADRTATRGVRLRLVERFDDAELTRMVASGELDACVVRFPLADKRLHVEPVADEPFAAVLPTEHQLNDRTALTLGELADEPVVSWPRNTAPDAYDAVVLACASAGFAPRVVQETVSVATLLALVAARMGVSLLATG